MGAEAVALRMKTPGRWRLRHLLAAAAVLAAVLALPYAVPAPGGPAVREVAVLMPASSVLAPQRVRAAARRAIHGGLLALDLDGVRAAVESLPWVAHAEVRREWPDALEIRVALERPVARWGARGLVDDAGRLFVPGSIAAFGALPQLSGPRGSTARVLADYERARALLRPAGLRPAGLAENARGEMRLQLAGGPAVELGRDDPLARLARFVNIAVPALGKDLARAGTVDMRYPNGFAVGWKGDGDHGKEN